jgi:hypothetical protein
MRLDRKSGLMLAEADITTPPIVAEVERLHWRIWNGKARDAQLTLKRIRKGMHVFSSLLKNDFRNRSTKD